MSEKRPYFLLLENICSDTIDTADLRSSENELEEKFTKEALPPDFIEGITTEIFDKTSEPKINVTAALTFQSAITLKNWSKINEKSTEEIKQKLFQFLFDENKVIQASIKKLYSKILVIETTLIQTQKKIRHDTIPELLKSYDKSTNRTEILETFESYVDLSSSYSVDVSDFLYSMLSKILVISEKDDEKLQIAGFSLLEELLNNAHFILRQQKPNNVDDVIKMILKGCKYKNEEINLISIDILTLMVSNYYQNLSPFMDQIYKLTIFEISKKSTENEKKCQKNIEFWNTLAETEIEINDFKFILKYYENLIPLILEKVIDIKPEYYEIMNPDLDTLDYRKSASIFIQIISEILKEKIIPLTLPFIKKNISSNSNFIFQESAILILGCILQFIPNLDFEIKDFKNLEKLSKSESIPLKETLSWCLGKIQKNQILDETGIFLEKIFKKILKILNKLLKDSNFQIKIHSCESLNLFLENNIEYFQEKNILNYYFSDLLNSLSEMTEEYTDDEGTWSTVLQTLGLLLHLTPDDFKNTVSKKIEFFINQISNLIESQNKNKNQNIEKTTEKIGVLSSVLVLTKVDFNLSEKIWNILYKSIKSGFISEDLVFSFATMITEEYEIINQDKMKLILELISNYITNFDIKNRDICRASLGLIGDIARKLDDEIFEPYAKPIISKLFYNFKKKKISKLITEPLIDCLGNVIYSMQSDVDPYIQDIMRILYIQSLEFSDSISLAICTVYNCIVYSVSSFDILERYCNQMIDFIRDSYFLISDENKSKIGVLLGDLGQVGEKQFVPFLQQDFIDEILDDQVGDELMDWAVQVIAKLKEDP